MKSVWLALTILAAMNVSTAAFADDEVAIAEQSDKSVEHEVSSSEGSEETKDKE